MKTHVLRRTVAILVVACIAASIGCYPVYPPEGGYAFNQDSKSYDVPQEAGPPQAAPRYAVDPALAIAGVAAAGLLGYAIGNNHGYHNHYYGGGVYYRPMPYRYGYYGPRYCR